MLRSNLNQQNAYELICIEELVPSDHLMRKIHQHIDFSFITDKVRSYYCETNGRPAMVTQQTRDYLQELDEAVKQDRMDHGKVSLSESTGTDLFNHRSQRLPHVQIESGNL
jgi:ABC-type ATPase with predicted acetyltransferase domain